MVVMQGWEAAHDVAGLGVVGQEVQHAPALLHVLPWAGLQTVHQVHELDAVADEEHGDVVLRMHQKSVSTLGLGMTSAADARAMRRRFMQADLRASRGRYGLCSGSGPTQGGKRTPTKSQLPSSVYIFTEKPRTSRIVSGEPRSCTTVEKRAVSCVFLPTCKPGIEMMLSAPLELTCTPMPAWLFSAAPCTPPHALILDLHFESHSFRLPRSGSQQMSGR